MWLLDYPPTILWATLGAIAIILEASGISGIGLLFAGLASFCVAILVSFHWVAWDAHGIQLAWFFGFTVAWTLLLWKPLQRMLHPKVTDALPDLVGDTAILATPLGHGHNGQARWSGTVMNAELSPNEPESELPAETRVTIVDVRGNTLIVTRKL